MKDTKRQCVWCKKGYNIKKSYHTIDGKEHFYTDKLTRFCGKSCSAKWRMSQPEIYKKTHCTKTYTKISKGLKKWMNSGHPVALAQIERIRNSNCMSDPKVRAKVSKTLRAIHWKPPIQGGNGKPMPTAQANLLKALGALWQGEYPVTTGKKSPYPTCYKIDIANPLAKIGIEVDGSSHCSRKILDNKKTTLLNSLGWKIIRFRNKEVLDNINEVINKIRIHND